MFKFLIFPKISFHQILMIYASSLDFLKILEIFAVTVWTAFRVRVGMPLIGGKNY
jgi:hypothetical protein